MAVQRLKLEELPEEMVQNNISVQKPVKAGNEVILGVFKAIATVLAIRLFLFLSLVGTFSLSLIAIYDKTSQSLWVVIAYAFLTTGPLAFLEWKGKRNGG